MNTQVKRVAIYVRLSVSTEESVSIARQIEAAQKYAEARGWVVVGVFVDDGVSASKVKPEHRVGWSDLLHSSEQYDAVIVWKIDRLARRVLDFLHADEALQARGAAVVAVEDPIDMTTPQGRAFATLLAVFAEMEAAAISARVLDARRKMIADGRRPAGLPPYGWMHIVNPDRAIGGKVLAQDPERIAYVSTAATMALAGNSVYKIAKWLTETGAPLRLNKKGKHHNLRKGDAWSEYSVATLLRNPVLAGMTTHKGDVLRDGDGMPVVDESLAVLTVEERRKLVGLLDSRKRDAPKESTPALLAMLVVCDHCDGVMTRVHNGARRYYRCVNIECEFTYRAVNRDLLEEYVAKRLLDERGGLFLYEEVDVTPEDNAVDLANIEEALSDATRAMMEDGADMVMLAQRIGSLKELRTKARQERPNERIYKATGRTVAEAWETAVDDDERRTILLTQLESLRTRLAGRGQGFSEDRVDLRWRGVARPSELDAFEGEREFKLSIGG